MSYIFQALPQSSSAGRLNGNGPFIIFRDFLG